MRYFLLILVLFLVSAGSASMDVPVPDVPSIQIIPDLIAKGFDKILENQADNLYSSVGTNGTNVSTLLTSMMYQKNEFLVNPGVQKMKDFTAFWFFAFYIIFLLVGGIGVMREAADNSSFGNDNGSWRNQLYRDSYICSVSMGVLPVRITVVILPGMGSNQISIPSDDGSDCLHTNKCT